LHLFTLFGNFSFANSAMILPSSCFENQWNSNRYQCEGICFHYVLLALWSDIKSKSFRLGGCSYICFFTCIAGKTDPRYKKIHFYFYTLGVELAYIAYFLKYYWYWFRLGNYYYYDFAISTTSKL